MGGQGHIRDLAPRGAPVRRLVAENDVFQTGSHHHRSYLYRAKSLFYATSTTLGLSIGATRAASPVVP
jgi:hypothetical protein